MSYLERYRPDASPYEPGRRAPLSMQMPAREARLRALIEIAVADTFGVALPALRAPTRGRADAAFARQVIMYLAHVALGMSYRAVGRMMGRDRTTVAHACLVVETHRDDPVIDRTIQFLESSCAAFVASLPAPPRGRR